jgi:hypothetical protein
MTRHQPFALHLDPLILQEGQRHKLPIILMDRSKSMGAFGDAPLIAMNDYLASLQQEPNASSASVVIGSFADDARIEMPHVRLLEAKPLPTFELGVCTRLHATIADVLRELIIVTHRPGLIGRLEILLAVFTDGEDNPKTDAAEVRSLALEAQLLGFKLMFNGIGVDHKKKAPQIGFPIDLGCTVAANGEGIKRSMARATRITSMMLRGVSPCRDSTPPN